MNKNTPATPLTPVQQFYSTHSPSDAIRLAMADHRAHCDPMQPQSEFMTALHKALDRCDAYPQLVEALREVRLIAHRQKGRVTGERARKQADMGGSS